MNRQYPEAKDLTKTKAFKAWKSRQLNCEESSDDQTPGSPAAHTEPNGSDESPKSPETRTEPNESDQTPRSPADCTEPNGSDQTPKSPPTRTEPNENDQTLRSPADCTEPNILSVACEEIIPNNCIDSNDLSLEHVDDIVQRVINELEEDEMLREILDEQAGTQDEGIELDHDIELAAIIEPFDYQLEVEGVDW